MDGLNNELSRAAYELTYAREVATSHEAEIKAWAGEVSSFHRILADSERVLVASEADKSDIQEMCTISIQRTRAEAEATIEASNRLVETLLEEARARGAASGSTQQTNTNIGIHKDCSLYYSSGTSTGAKVIHADESCGLYQYTYEANRAMDGPCKRCMNPLLPAAP